MFELLFLGTSASAPSARRGLSALVVSHNEYRFLIDCGEGTQRQILQSGIGFKRLTRILLTHGHLDHILGLGGLLSTLLRWESIDELNIQVFRELFTYMNEHHNRITEALGLIMVSKALERVGDHATNIAERAIYYVKGVDVRHGNC